MNNFWTCIVALLILFAATVAGTIRIPKWTYRRGWGDAMKANEPRVDEAERILAATRGPDDGQEAVW